MADRHLDELARGTQTLTPAFTCAGRIDLTRPLDVRFGRNVRVCFDAKTVRGAGLEERLLRYCQKAAFGLGAETRVDTRVREGGQLRVDQGLVVNELDLQRSNVLETIRRALFPRYAKPPRAELYAVHVYPRDGHFVSHKDTPRDADVVGTLVVCMPTNFSGGELVVRHDAEVRYDWARHTHSREPVTTLCWAAFYGDVDHAIEPVRDGVRVTLTYLLRQDGEIGVDAGEDDRDGDTRPLVAALRGALSDPDFLPRGGTLGFPCAHLYARDAKLRDDRAGGLSANARTVLKGRDALIADCLHVVDLKARYRPHVYTDGAAWCLKRAPNERELAVFDEDRLTPADLETLPLDEGEDAWRYGEGRTVWVLDPPWSWKKERPSELASPARLLADLEYSTTGYFGNEGSDAAFYTMAALLVDVPSARERGASTRSSKQ